MSTPALNAGRLLARTISCLRPGSPAHAWFYGVLRPPTSCSPIDWNWAPAWPTPWQGSLRLLASVSASGWNEALVAQGDDAAQPGPTSNTSGAVKRKALQARVIDTESADLKNGQYKIISFYAKKARCGMMARYVIRERLRDPAGLKDFMPTVTSALSNPAPDQLVFLRDAPQDWISRPAVLAGRLSSARRRLLALPFVPPTPLLRRLSPRKALYGEWAYSTVRLQVMRNCITFFHAQPTGTFPPQGGNAISGVIHWPLPASRHYMQITIAKCMGRRLRNP